jgi:hypothetical protein
MNGFQKVEKIKAAPSNDLDLPERPQIQDVLSIHNSHFSLNSDSAFYGMAHKSFGSTHFSIVRQIWARHLNFVELRSQYGFE